VSRFTERFTYRDEIDPSFHVAERMNSERHRFAHPPTRSTASVE